MNYDLAKKLKDSGYPQEGEKWLSPDGYSVCNCGVSENEGQGPKLSKDIVEPDLSQLIHACGGKFKGLNILPDGWHAWSDIENPQEIVTVVHTEDGEDFFANGYIRSTGNSTPEEAVAKLWLKLKSNK